MSVNELDEEPPGCSWMSLWCVCVCVCEEVSMWEVTHLQTDEEI